MLKFMKATLVDARAALEIRHAAILNQCVGCYPMETLKIWASGELSDSFKDTVEKHFYIAVDCNQMIGTGMINIETGKIDAVFVHPDHMRKAIGRRIVQFLEEIAQRHRVEILSLESTLNAAAFYRACGFEGNEASVYISSKGVSLDCIPMSKKILPKQAF
jgi:GNAT superfamily N-acetyltransferase